MRYATSTRPRGAGASVVPAAVDAPGTRSIRFGDVWFHMTDAPDWDGPATAARATGTTLKPLPHVSPSRAPRQK